MGVISINQSNFSGLFFSNLRNAFQTLSTQEKKIIGIAAIAFGFLALMFSLDVHTFACKKIKLIFSGCQVLVLMQGFKIARLFHKKKLQERFVKAALRVDPLNRCVLKEYTKLLFSFRRFAEAETLNKSRLQIAPTDIIALTDCIDSLVNQEKMEEAAVVIENRFKNEIENNHSFECDDFNLLFMEGGSFVVAKYREFLKSKPNDFESLKNCAKALLDVNKLVEAAEYYKIALTIQPKNPMILKGYAKLLYRQNRLNDALECLKTILKFDSQNIQVLRNCGRILYKQAKFNESIDYFKKVLKELPLDLLSLCLYAEILRKEGKKQQSVFLFQNIFQTIENSETREISFIEMDSSLSNILLIDPTNFFALDLKVKLERYSPDPDFEMMQECLEKALKIEPDDILILKDTVICFGFQNKIDEVLNVLSRAVILYPNELFFLRAYGGYLMARKDLEKARIYFKAALSVDGNDFKTMLYYGELLRYQKDFDLSETYIKASVDKEPNDAVGLRIYSELLKEKGKLGEGMVTLEHILELVDDDFGDAKNYVEILNTLGQLNRGTVFAEALFKNNCFLGNSKRILDEILQINPNHFHALRVCAQMYDQNGDTYKAIFYFKKALRIQPNDLQTLICYGEVLYALDKIDKSKVVFKKALQSDSASIEALVGCGMIATRMNEIAKALDYFKLALKKDPNNRKIFKEYGEALYRLGEFDRAVKYFKKVLKEDTKDFFSLAISSEVLLKKGKIDQSKVLLERAKKVIPQDFSHKKECSNVQKYVFLYHLEKKMDIPLSLASSLVENNEFDRAMVLYEYILKYEPNNFIALLEYGQLLQAEKIYPRAAALYQKALKIDATHFSLLKGYGKLKVDTCDFIVAERYLLDGLKINPKDPELLYAYAYTLYHFDRLEDSQVYYKYSLQMEPSDPAVLLSYSQLLHKLKDFQEELNCYEEALKVDPKDFLTLCFCAITLSQLGRTEEERLKLKEAVELIADGIEDYISDLFDYVEALTERKELDEAFNLILALKKYGKCEPANFLLRSILKVEPNNFRALSLLAEIYANNADYKEALSYYESALKIKNDDVSLLTGYGTTLTRLDRKNEACQFFLKALAINPEDFTTVSCYGQFLESLGNYKEAAVYFQKALKKRPDHLIHEYFYQRTTNLSLSVVEKT